MKTLLPLLTLLFAAGTTQAQIGFINEFHYDNVSTDTDEFIEVALATNATATDYAIVLYNGNDGNSYGTAANLGSACTSTTTVSNGYRLYFCDYPSNGIQNGSPDGIALVNQTTSTLVEFISYEGSFQAANGIAAGATSLDVGVAEPLDISLGGSTGGSIQRYGAVADNTWDVLATSSKGFLNSNQSALPVELVSFTGAADGSGALLRWMTASETNNAGFEVQQQSGAAWKTVGFVPGKGNSVEAEHYRFTVATLAAGTYRFRLRQVDFDGTFAFSPEVELTVGMETTFTLSALSPNPTRDRIAFTVAVQRGQHVTADLYNLLGRRVATLFSGPVAEGAAQRIAFDAAALPAGVYVYRVQGETFSTSRQVTLLR